MPDLRIGEVLALRRSGLDFRYELIRVRQAIDGATRETQACE
jgi:hypothetical protein